MSQDLDELSEVALFAALMEQVRLADEWDHDFTAPPYSPEPLRARLVERGAEAVPVLVESLRSRHRPTREEAARTLMRLGPVAAPEAVAALASEPTPVAALALFFVDEAAARARGLHLRADLRVPIVRELARRGPEALVRYLDELLWASEPELLRFALKGDGFSSSYEGLLERRSDLIPLERVRSLCAHDEDEVASAAAWLLCQLHLPEDRPRLIASGRRLRRLAPGLVEHLAPHPASLELLEALTAEGKASQPLVTLVQRRRCAGLSTPTEPLRELLHDEVRLRPKRPFDRTEMRVAWAVRIVGELGDEGLLDEVRQAAGHPRHDSHVLSEAINLCLARFGRRPGNAYYTLEQGDQLFLKGQVDTSSSCAFKVYAEVLRLKPSAHAAFQLAWIDRAFGAGPDPERVEWVRGLGFDDEALLEELATPVERPLPGHRLRWAAGARDAAKVAYLAPMAEAAGLHCLAAVLRQRGDDLEAYRRPRAAAEAHLERVGEACRRAAT